MSVSLQVDEKSMLPLAFNSNNSFVRAKPLQNASCVDVTVQLTDTLDNVPVPAPGGELVRQEKFVIVNKRPTTITVTTRSDGWSVRNNRNDQVRYKP